MGKTFDKFTTIGCMHIGDYFRCQNRLYKVGCVISNTNGYVACVGEDHKVHRFYIDTQVEKVREQE